MMMETGKPKKQRQAGAKVRPVCGTLSYLAECRGLTKKAEVSRWTAPPGNSNIVRKYPATS